MVGHDHSAPDVSGVVLPPELVVDQLVLLWNLFSCVGGSFAVKLVCYWAVAPNQPVHFLHSFSTIHNRLNTNLVKNLFSCSLKWRTTVDASLRPVDVVSCCLYSFVAMAYKSFYMSLPGH